MRGFDRDALLGFPGLRADVRRGDDLRMRGEGMAVGGLVLVDVEPCAGELPCFEGGEQRVLVDQPC